ncbi:MAG TPA: hypothetical protein VFI16_08735, partial [Anaeromyxobacteraceae bacterium]|nr:hypothetical protein [Anaeromyxobacteraceae bacterium]
PQTVTATGVDDVIIDGTQPYTIVTGLATSLDTSFAGVNPADVALTNTDNDVASLVANPSSGLVTTETGGTATFQLTLSSQPLADVVVAIASSNANEGTAAPASATFTAITWNVAQTVTVTGVDDLVFDGPTPYAIQLSASSPDPAYDLATGSVSVTNNP